MYDITFYNYLIEIAELALELVYFVFCLSCLFTSLRDKMPSITTANVRLVDGENSEKVATC